MNWKWFLIFVPVLLSIWSAAAAPVAEVYNANDVVACRYYGSLGLLDLQSGADATLLTDSDIIDFTWDKQGKNIFVLYSVSIPGPDYESPDRNEVRLYELSLPAATKALLKTIKVPEPQDYDGYSYPTLCLNKDGNPVITLHYGISDQKYLQYTYNLTSKVLSTPVNKSFNVFKDGYKRKHQPQIRTDAGKYYSESDGTVYDLYTTDPDGNPLRLTDMESSKYGTSMIDAPLRYCVSPDSSFVLVSYLWDETIPMGCTYALSPDGETFNLLSAENYLGENFIPCWLSDGRLAFLERADYILEIKNTSIKIVEKDGSITQFKAWENEKDGPLDIQYRVH